MLSKESLAKIDLFLEDEKILRNWLVSNRNNMSNLMSTLKMLSFRTNAYQDGFNYQNARLILEEMWKKLEYMKEKINDLNRFIGELVEKNNVTEQELFNVENECKNVLEFQSLITEFSKSSDISELATKYPNGVKCLLPDCDRICPLSVVPITEMVEEVVENSEEKVN